MVFELVKFGLSPERAEKLVTIISRSRVFSIDYHGYVDVRNAKTGHPETQFGPRPVGLVTSDRAVLLNKGIHSLKEYHELLETFYHSV
ncbi:hypothetical protein HYX06_06775 [Candidatus Woesearchaeota archaeon]|nr:hypothetical protein [Candidatus Woesearchaeota archaeon]